MVAGRLISIFRHLKHGKALRAFINRAYKLASLVQITVSKYVVEYLNIYIYMLCLLLSNFGLDLYVITVLKCIKRTTDFILSHPFIINAFFKRQNPEAVGKVVLTD